jgi:LacI family transcriptional regulator
MATIKDVASAAGVSYTTVSHVVNGTRPVSDEAKRKVEDAVRQLGYVPSAVARSLKQSETFTVGVLIPSSINPFFAELTRGIEDYCHGAGYCVFLCNSDDDPRRQRNYLRVLLEKRVDGLIVASAGDTAALAEGLARTAIPLVVLDRPVPGVSASQVSIDHETGAYLATRHLLDAGHRAIACVRGPKGLEVSEARLAGWSRALTEAGVKPNIRWVVQGDFSSASGYRAGLKLLEAQRVSAVFACNDLMAIGVLRAAAERGVSVPEQLSVVGFDDIELGRYVYPALTTVGGSIRGLGETAAQVLIEAIRSDEPATRTVSVTPRLFLRESTAAAAT